METFIVKRDGTREAFSMEKIQRAIAKAFLSVGSFATQDVITNILSHTQNRIDQPAHIDVADFGAFAL